MTDRQKLELMFSKFREALAEWESALESRNIELLKKKALEVEKLGNEILKTLGVWVKSGYNVEDIIRDIEEGRLSLEEFLSSEEKSQSSEEKS